MEVTTVRRPISPVLRPEERGHELIIISFMFHLDVERHQVVQFKWTGQASGLSGVLSALWSEYYIFELLLSCEF